LIKGKYVIKSGDEIIAETENKIMTKGVEAINLYLTNGIADWAGSIGYGATTEANTASNITYLRYELGKAVVSSKTYLSASNQIVIKASIPNTFSGEVYELGVFPTNIVSGNKDAFVFTNFDEILSSTGTGSSAWLQGSSNLSSNSAASLSSTSRASASSIYVNTSSVLSNFSIVADLSDYTSSDRLHLLYYVPTTGSAAIPASITFTFYDSNSASWSSSATALDQTSPGFKYTFISMQAPDPYWSGVVTNITASFANSANSSNKNIVFDALRFRENATTKPIENTLVSRAISTSSTVPIFSTTYGQPLQIEYYLTVS